MDSGGPVVFLCGYDYLSVFREIQEHDIRVVVPSDEPFVPTQLRDKLADLMKDRVRSCRYQELSACLDELRAETLISMGWRRMIPEEVLAMHRLNINVHPAILPQYKGYHPVPHVIMNLEREHGITAHLITDEIDGGPIVHQETFSVSVFSTLRSLQGKVLEMMPGFVGALLDKVTASASLVLDENEDSRTVIVAGKRTPEDSRLSPEQTLLSAYHQWRACDEGRFPAYLLVEGERVFVKFCRSEDASRVSPHDV